MATKTVSFRLPVELAEAIEAEASATGQSRTKVVTAILSKFYDYPYVSPQSTTLEQLQEQLNELRQLMANIEAPSIGDLFQVQSASRDGNPSHQLEVALQNSDSAQFRDTSNLPI